MHKDRLHEKQFLNIVDDLYRFIMHEVVNTRRKYFYDAQELATDPKYIGLREWENQEHRAVPPLVAFVGNREKICIQYAL
jgi:hypothetical protein